jgi:16S rRNA (guanine966-N2)-methyltransferase
VDISRRAISAIKDNLRRHDLADVTFSQQDALEYLQKANRPFHWIFCDPPYTRANYGALLMALSQSAALGPESLLILESDRFHTFELPPTLRAIDRRKFGDTIIHFIKRAEAGIMNNERRA